MKFSAKQTRSFFKVLIILFLFFSKASLQWNIQEKTWYEDNRSKSVGSRCYVCSPSCNIFTSQNMNINWNIFSQARGTWIGARVCRISILNHKETGRYVSFFGDNTYTATRRVIRNYSIIMSPKYVWGRLRAICTGKFFLRNSDSKKWLFTSFPYFWDVF